MVRLVPPFLRNIIGLSENPQHVTPNHFDDPEFAGDNLDECKDSDPKSLIHSDTLDAIKDEQLEALEITTNIATIAPIDWGPPKLNAGILDELGNSGRYLFDMIRGNKTNFENLDDLTKSIKKVPIVYESDFNVYLEQINEIYSEYLNFNVIVDELVDDMDLGLGLKGNIDSVCREYFEDDYNIHQNSIFNSDLDKIPESIEFLESQLMTVNGQLRELVGTHLKHVGDSFACIEDLKSSFVNVNCQISNVRVIFDNLRGIYKSPVSYSHLKDSKVRQDSLASNSSCSGYTLHDVLLFKKRVVEVLEYLKVLKGVSCTPEYIQSIIEVNMALAKIFANSALQYFESDLSKFSLTNSVTLVVRDTVTNLERVSEAKFIDLTLFALTQCYSYGDTTLFETDLKSTIDKLEPVLIVLVTGGVIDDILTTLLGTTTPFIKSVSKELNLDFFKEELDLVLKGFVNSNVLLQHLLNSLVCIYLFNLDGDYVPNTEIARNIVRKMIFKIQDNFTNGINRDYQKIAETTQFLKNELKLPRTCKYNSALLPNHPHNAVDLVNSVNNFVSNGSEDVDNDKMMNDLYKYYEKLSCVIENGFIRSLENLFSCLKLNAANGDGFDLDAIIISFKLIESIYVEFVNRCVEISKMSENVVLGQFQNHVVSHGFKCNPRFNLGGKDFRPALTDILNKYIFVEIKKNVEVMFERSLVKVHESLNQEDWDCFEELQLEGKGYNLVKSSLKLNEDLNMYFGISEKFTFLSNTTISKCINLFAYFTTLIENELEKNLGIKKLCLITQTLDYFTLLIPLKIRAQSSSGPNEDFNPEESDRKNYDLLLVLGINAENCVLEAKLLRNKSADLLANFIFSQIKIHLINWIFKYTDLQDEKQSEDATEDVDLITNQISSLYSDCFQFFPLNDLKETFSHSFDRLVDLAKRQNVDFSRFDKFSDDCTRIITNLSHIPDLKLEILSLAHRLSN